MIGPWGLKTDIRIETVFKFRNEFETSNQLATLIPLCEKKESGTVDDNGKSLCHSLRPADSRGIAASTTQFKGRV